MTVEALLARCRELVAGARGDVARMAGALRRPKVRRVVVAVVVVPWLALAGAAAALWRWCADDLDVSGYPTPADVYVPRCAPSWAGERVACVDGRGEVEVSR